MLLLKKTTFEVESDGPLVKAGEAKALSRAEEIVAAAEAEAAKIAEDAKAAYEAEKKRGYADGVAAGREQILMQKLELLDSSVRFMERTEGKMTELVMKALKKCIAEIGDKELVCQIVRKSLQAIVRNQRQITVKVSPEMVPAVRERVKTIMQDFPSVSEMTVVEDAHLAATACIVETEAGLVEASVDGQLAAIEKSLRKSFGKGK